MQTISYLGIGSNLGDRLKNIKGSISYLKLNQRIKILKISRLYETLPQGGPKNQPKYLNAAVKIQTSFSPLDLLAELKVIEKKLKRKKALHWGPRAMDLDVLFYGGLIFLSDKLSIPHPLLHKRAFVLKPLAEIAPNFIHPLYQRRIKDLLRERGGKNEEIASFN